MYGLANPPWEREEGRIGGWGVLLPLPPFVLSSSRLPLTARRRAHITFISKTQKAASLWLMKAGEGGKEGEGIPNSGGYPEVL